jgi:hypothetical protein
MPQPQHTYPLSYRPGTYWALEDAWDILDSLQPGVLSETIRDFLAGQIAGALMRRAGEPWRALDVPNPVPNPALRRPGEETPHADYPDRTITLALTEALRLVSTLVPLLGLDLAPSPRMAYTTAAVQAAQVALDEALRQWQGPLGPVPRPVTPEETPHGDA